MSISSSTLSRGSSPNRNRIYTIQPNVSLNRGNHNIRSGLDLRSTNVFNENYNNSGGNLDFTRQFTRSTINSTAALEGNAFASFLLGAPNSASVDVNPKPHYQWFFVAPWIQDDWRVTNKLTLNLGFRWDINGSVTEEDNMLNYAFDPTIVNPVSARVGQPVMGGIRFAGVDGAPDRPWKLDKDNWQGRVGMAYSINEKTVFRAGYGKYFLNPTGQGNNAGFSQSTNLIASLDGGRTPTYALSNPWPNGIQTPPGSSLGPLTFLGRSPNFSNPDFVVPNVHQFSVGIQRELPWNVSLDMTYAGSRSYDLETGFNAYNEPSAAFQATCDVTLGGSRNNCDQLVTNPFFSVPGFEGTTRFTNQTLSRFELARPFPAFGGITQNQNNIGKLVYDSAQFVANKRWAKGVTINASYTYVPRWTETGGYVGCGVGAPQRGSLLLAAQAPHHRVWRMGAAVVPRSEKHRGLPPRRLVDRADARLPVRPALGYARQRRSGAGRQPRRHRAGGQEGRAVHLRRQAVHRPAQRDNRHLQSVSRFDGVRLHRALLPDPRELPAPHRDEPLRRVPPPIIHPGGCELREDDADHERRSVPVRVSRPSTSSTARSTTSGSTTRTPTALTSVASIETALVSRTSSGSSRWASG